MMAMADGRRLEARFAPAARSELAVLCHPHPLFGGSMDNPVVLALRDVLWAAGIATLRFNYRGVGQSEGSYGAGEGEAEDLKRLLDSLGSHEHARDGIHLGGYSFGAWISLQACQLGAAPNRVVLVSPPVDFMSFEDLRLPAGRCLITVGDEDELCTPASLEQWLRRARGDDTDLETAAIPETDHFYTNRLDALRRAVDSFVRGNAGANWD